MRKALFVLVFGLIATLLIAWAPWQSGPTARAQAEAAFTHAWQNVADGCGFHCSGCGAIEDQKSIFGTFVTLVYACGLQPADDPSNHQRALVFVSFLGTVHGLPGP